MMAKLNRLKLVLAEQDKTIKWLDEKVGKSASSFSKWCSNSIRLDLKTLNEIADLLVVDAKDVIVSKKIKVPNIVVLFLYPNG